MGNEFDIYALVKEATEQGKKMARRFFSGGPTAIQFSESQLADLAARAYEEGYRAAKAENA